MVDLKWFAHGLNAFNLTKGNAPEETFDNDVVTPQIAQAHAQQREAARDIEQFDDYEGRSRHEMAMRDRILQVGAHFAADRVALRRTMQFIEERWRSGATLDETYVEAEQFRVDEYAKLSGNKRIMRDLERSIRDLHPEKAKALLVDAAPVRKAK